MANAQTEYVSAIKTPQPGSGVELIAVTAAVPHMDLRALHYAYHVGWVLAETVLVVMEAVSALTDGVVLGALRTALGLPWMFATVTEHALTVYTAHVTSSTSVLTVAASVQ
jgi:hypothetical protein